MAALFSADLYSRLKAHLALGKDPREVHPGDVVNIPAGVRHWYGAADDSWFQHLAIEIPGKDGKTGWLEPVDDEQYNN